MNYSKSFFYLGKISHKHFFSIKKLICSSTYNKNKIVEAFKTGQHQIDEDSLSLPFFFEIEYEYNKNIYSKKIFVSIRTSSAELIHKQFKDCICLKYTCKSLNNDILLKLPANKNQRKYIVEDVTKREFFFNIKQIDVLKKLIPLTEKINESKTLIPCDFEEMIQKLNGYSYIKCNYETLSFPINVNHINFSYLIEKTQDYISFLQNTKRVKIERIKLQFKSSSVEQIYKELEKNKIDDIQINNMNNNLFNFLLIKCFWNSDLVTLHKLLKRKNVGYFLIFYYENCDIFVPFEVYMLIINCEFKFCEYIRNLEEQEEKSLKNWFYHTGFEEYKNKHFLDNRQNVHCEANSKKEREKILELEKFILIFDFRLNIIEHEEFIESFYKLKFFKKFKFEKLFKKKIFNFYFGNNVSERRIKNLKPEFLEIDEKNCLFFLIFENIKSFYSLQILYQILKFPEFNSNFKKLDYKL